MKQRTLAMMTGFEQYTRTTRRALFLEEMEQVVPWRAGSLCGKPLPGPSHRAWKSLRISRESPLLR
jgi:hypothetical protein